MKTLFALADRYLEESDWKRLAVLKICLISMGVWLGSHVTGRAEKPARILSGAAFWAAYLPLMAGFFGTAARFLKEDGR